jgi:tetraacyldisaccharide 4'-kinase
MVLTLPCIGCSSGKMRPDISRWIESFWYDRSIRGLLFAIVLAPLTFLYWLLTSLRRKCYSLGVFSSLKSKVPIIVVGNITTGGSGKTPVVIWLARQMHAQGYRPGIVSRGYGGVRPQDQVSVTTESFAIEVGDEPLLIARNTGFPVQVGANRVEAVNELLQRTDVDLIISDDGMQHYALDRDVEIAVIDAARELGNSWLLPSGPLRELGSRLDSVDLVIANGCSKKYEHYFELAPEMAVNLKTKEHCHLDEFAGKTVRALAGIGNPKRFYDLLAEHKIKTVPVAVEDHGHVDLAELEAEGGLLFMTEKDAVKYAGTFGLDCWYVPIKLVFPPTVEKMLINKLRALLLQD